jgi:hypothetical protein
MITLHNLLDETPKKMQVLAIIRDYGAEDALRKYPELEAFIYMMKDMGYEDARRSLLNDPQTEPMLIR